MKKTSQKTVIFCHDTYYCRHSNQEIYAFGAFPYKLWVERFLPHFDQVKIIGRDKGACDSDVSMLDCSSGPNVTHILLPNINAPLKRLLQGRRLYKEIYRQVSEVDGVIIRGPVEFGMMAARAARAQKKPYAVEMSGCAFDHTWFHGSIIGHLYAPIKYLRARHMVARADQVIYVTQRFLQKRYPANGRIEFASNVEITAPEEAVLTQRLARINAKPSTLKIGLIGNYGNALKGLDIAINVLGRLKDEGYKFDLHVLGSGDPQRWHEAMKQQGLEEHIHFDGTLPGGDQVMTWLDGLDLYIQPSRHEGLPRAVIEAMSRGLPCLISNAGGADELLDPYCIHKKGSADQLYYQLKGIWSDWSWQAEQAENNFLRAKDYTAEVLKPKREAFWQQFLSKL